MSERMDVLMARDYVTGQGEAKTSYTKIGVAFATKNGGWSLKLEAVPVPTLGKDGAPMIGLLMMPPRDPQSQPSQAQASSRPQASVPPKFEDGGRDDDIPF